jgi:sulfotransferase
MGWWWAGWGRTGGLNFLSARIFDNKPGSSIYSRVEMLMNSESGLIGLPWSSLREAWFGDGANRLIIVPYDTLATYPERTMRGLYAALGEPYFSHDFENVSYQKMHARS